MELAIPKLAAIKQKDEKTTSQAAGPPSGNDNVPDIVWVSWFSNWFSSSPPASADDNASCLARGTSCVCCRSCCMFSLSREGSDIVGLLSVFANWESVKLLILLLFSGQNHQAAKCVVGIR
ncbi:hypothetical protein D8B26_007404 [Coccidioides posadasii str. Silveira]|uniref:uncharacterized protein n=1 Tax=Coccidioides posadasii (strain RMSCC 757 / Silveira) TaxID=443226 RepID=UPI001BED9417|nr:hypothetical protein D8B26_007404 [Coccidioides posadasii str. Silveira]